MKRFWNSFKKVSSSMFVHRTNFLSLINFKSAVLCLRGEVNTQIRNTFVNTQLRNNFIKILNDIRQLCTFHISCDLLLYGAVELDYATNCKSFDAVHDYIEETGRL